MRQVPLEHDINIAINGPFWVEVANPEHPFTAMLISHSRGTFLISGLTRASCLPRSGFEVLSLDTCLPVLLTLAKTRGYL